jgi:outer membrane protein TolC
MRHRFGVLFLLASLLVGLTPAGWVAAQPTASPAPQTPAAPGAPGPAAPSPAATQSGQQLQPSAAAAAPASSVDQPDAFNLPEALRGGEPLTSDDAARRAVKTAPSLAKTEAAAAKAAAAAEQLNIALYPKLDLEARYTRVSEVELPNFLPPGSTQKPLLVNQVDQGLFQARLTWPVSTIFFTIMPRHAALSKIAVAQKLQTHVEEETIKLRTREAYYNYARARAALMVTKAALAQAEAHRKDSEALVAAGSIARVELMRAEAQMATAKVSLIRADFLVATTRSALYSIVHIDGNADVTVSEDLEAELPALSENEEAVYQRALDRRTEIKALRTIAESQEHSIAAARGQALPVVAIGGQIEQANPNQRWFGTYHAWKGDWAAFVSLVWTPTETFSALKSIDQAKADYAQTQADLRSLQDALRVEVSQAYNGLQSARAALESTRAGIMAAEESYRVRREQYRAGAAIAVDVIDSESQLRQARLDLVNALIEQRIAKARLDRAIEAE